MRQQVVINGSRRNNNSEKDLPCCPACGPDARQTLARWKVLPGRNTRQLRAIKIPEASRPGGQFRILPGLYNFHLAEGGY